MADEENVMLKVEKQVEAEKVPSGSIRFYAEASEEILRLEADGDIYVRGKLVENDKEVVEGLRVFLETPTARVAILSRQIVTLAVWVTKEFDMGHLENAERGRANIRNKCRELELLGVEITESPLE